MHLLHILLVIAALFPIGLLGELVSIGTLFAFVIVSIGVLVLRKTQPDRPRSFRVPLSPLLPILSILFCGALMLSLPTATWIRFIVWLLIGLVIYFAYSKSRVASERADSSEL